MPQVSVVICTRNPDVQTFSRVFHSLAAQTLSRASWEIVVVDNASQPPVALPIVEPLPACRVVVEAAPGVAAARVRGIRESQGGLIVFVDDDNLLDPDYLSSAIAIAEAFPQIGAFGGRIAADGDLSLPAWIEPFRSHVALVDFKDDEWGKGPAEHAVVPYGAGLCIRRKAARGYAESSEASRRRAALGGRPGSLRVSEDTDLVLTCLDQGWGTGRFTALHLRHVIPDSRLEFTYQKRLAHDIGYAYGHLLALRGFTSRGRRLIALAKAGLAFLGVKHRGKARALDLAYHWGFCRGLGSVAR